MQKIMYIAKCYFMSIYHIAAKARKREREREREREKERERERCAPECMPIKG